MPLMTIVGFPDPITTATRVFQAKKGWHRVVLTATPYDNTVFVGNNSGLSTSSALFLPRNRAAIVIEVPPGDELWAQGSSGDGIALAYWPISPP